MWAPRNLLLSLNQRPQTMNNNHVHRAQHTYEAVVNISYWIHILSLNMIMALLFAIRNLHIQMLGKYFLSTIRCCTLSEWVFLHYIMTTHSFLAQSYCICNVFLLLGTKHPSNTANDSSRCKYFNCSRCCTRKLLLRLDGMKLCKTGCIIL